MHRAAAVVAGIALAALTACQPVRPRAAPRPKLVVLVVVDQLPTWAFEHDRQFFTGGFARMLREGGHVIGASLPYASPFTAVGHATIGTGTTPNVHGVFGNSWYRRADGRDVPAETDETAQVWSVGPEEGGTLGPDDRASGAELRIDGTADALRAATGGKAHSVAVALKARASVFMTGRHPDLAIWYEPAAGGMTTSSAYADAAPPWLVEHARTHPASRFFTRVWTARDPVLLASATGTSDDETGEGSVHGLGRTFPHSLAASDQPARAILHTPFGDELVADAALAALDAMDLGADDIPDLLAVSFSAHDYAGHLWGPTSWEQLELTFALDRELGLLFEELDRRVGPDGWACVLTSDHGATPLVERSFTIGARRIRSAELVDAVEAAFVAAAGPAPRRTSATPASDGPKDAPSPMTRAADPGVGHWVAKEVSSSVYLDEAALALPDAVRDAALADATRRLLAIDGVAAAGRSDRIAGHCETRKGLEQAICLSMVPNAAGELYVMPVAGSLISDFNSGTHHDAPFDDNRLVPILVRAPGLARRIGTGDLLQVAPTIAALLGVPPPPGATEAPLFGIAAQASTVPAAPPP